MSAQTLKQRLFGSPVTPLNVKIPELTPRQLSKSPERSPNFASDNESTFSSTSTQAGSEENKQQLTFDPYTSAEQYRLDEARLGHKEWKKWGPYVSERQWATVREDYSENGDAWSHFPHEMARSRAYRWGEDGIGGFSDDQGRLNFSLGLWNGVDHIIKERLFGVTGHEGNHGEAVKELYWYQDSTPTHSYMSFRYKYPQQAFPYANLIKESRSRSRDTTEFSLIDSGVFSEDRYWDIEIEYAKDAEDPHSTSIRIVAHNRGPEPASLHLIPQLTFANTWSWPSPAPPRPSLQQIGSGVISAEHETLGKTHLYCAPSPAPATSRASLDNVDENDIQPELLFTENDTNFERLYGGQNPTPYVKDAFHDHIILSHRPKADASEPSTSNSPPSSTRSFVNPDKKGTKAAAHYFFENVPANGGCVVVRLKLTPNAPSDDPALSDDEPYDANILARKHEADEFYAGLTKLVGNEDLRGISRQALAGMLWSKQFYQFNQPVWINGDPAQPAPPPNRKYIRNQDWRHMNISAVLSMPDKWEYPFFAVWDTAFHCIPLVMVDPEFAKNQLELFVSETYMKRDGAIPAYEWNFSDVNPPVHAWSTFRVYKLERKLYGREDRGFLERMFRKLMLNFNWWMNKKDRDGKSVFEGGFLGLDNIGAFNRSEPLPGGGALRQADGTAWMAFFALNMMNMAIELAKTNSTYESDAFHYFEHFVAISDAMTYDGADGPQTSLWNEEQGLYVDAIQWPGSETHPQHIPVRSLVGLIPLYATLTLEPMVIDRLPTFKKRMDVFIAARPEVSSRNITNMLMPGRGERRLLALASRERLVKILQKMLDENEFLSDYGIRSLSLHHKDNPFSMHLAGQDIGVEYWPGDSKSGMFGGNSNWRGPIWLATNFLLIESLQRFYQYYGDELEVECPTGSGQHMNLCKVAEEIQHRIIHIFARDQRGRRATNGGNDKLDFDPHFKDLVLFHEFFHADDGHGLGASHQTGWTGLVAFNIIQSGSTCRLPKTPRTPGTVALHYFDEKLLDSEETDQEAVQSAFVLSAVGDISPDAL